MYDLSHPIANGMQTFPDDPDVHISPATNFEKDGCRVTDLRFGSHTGTHVDAPSHTEPRGKSLDEFSVGRFVGDAIRVDC